eukprot:14617653-Heterocapsa_arctica.AAC.1
MEEKLDSMRAKLNNERSQRWRSWVEHSWGHKKIYLQMDQSSGGSAQMKDIMKLAEDIWGGLWAVDAEDLPKFSKQHAFDYRR